ncbi:hypothetical protein ACIQM4_25655 [Streptomyces sp. NPDC091272]|uniref:hypothetical protein n=1 Tax=Streptomyces sp. NPDC091272 TaxID=3365981 RepID=UPI0038183B05
MMSELAHLPRLDPAVEEDYIRSAPGLDQRPKLRTVGSLHDNSDAMGRLLGRGHGRPHKGRAAGKYCGIHEWPFFFERQPSVVRSQTFRSVASRVCEHLPGRDGP